MHSTESACARMSGNERPRNPGSQQPPSKSWLSSLGNFLSYDRDVARRPYGPSRRLPGSLIDDEEALRISSRIGPSPSRLGSPWVVDEAPRKPSPIGPAWTAELGCPAPDIRYDTLPSIHLDITRISAKIAHPQLAALSNRRKLASMPKVFAIHVPGYLSSTFVATVDISICLLVHSCGGQRSIVSSAR